MAQEPDWTGWDDDGEEQPAVGHVPVTGRGSLPFALVHGESLVATASWALGEAGVDLLDFTVTWPRIRTDGRALVLHDPLCPLTPVPFLRAAVAAAGNEVVVGVHPVTDTVKTVRDGVVGGTVDRDSLWQVTSPVVLPAEVVQALAAWPELDDFAALVDGLRDRFEVRFLEAPALGRRVDDESAVRMLETFADELRAGAPPASGPPGR